MQSSIMDDITGFTTESGEWIPVNFSDKDEEDRGARLPDHLKWLAKGIYIGLKRGKNKEVDHE